MKITWIELIIQWAWVHAWNVHAWSHGGGLSSSFHLYPSSKLLDHHQHKNSDKLSEKSTWKSSSSKIVLETLLFSSWWWSWVLGGIMEVGVLWLGSSWLGRPACLIIVLVVPWSRLIMLELLPVSSCTIARNSETFLVFTIIGLEIYFIFIGFLSTFMGFCLSGWWWWSCLLSLPFSIDTREKDQRERERESRVWYAFLLHLIGFIKGLEWGSKKKALKGQTREKKISIWFFSGSWEKNCIFQGEKKKERKKKMWWWGQNLRATDQDVIASNLDTVSIYLSICLSNINCKKNSSTQICIVWYLSGLNF